MRKKKGLARKTIALFDDKTITNTDILFTVDGIIPVIYDMEKPNISYFSLVSINNTESITQKLQSVLSSDEGKKYLLDAIPEAGIAEALNAPGIFVGKAMIENKAIDTVIDAVRPMFDEICDALIKLPE